MTAARSGCFYRAHLARSASRYLGAALAVAVAALLAACATSRVEVPRPHSLAIDRPEETFLGRTFGAQLAASPGRSGFRLLVSGRDAFLARAATAASAQRSLDLQYYAVADDATATLLLYQALRAAERGVRVRLLLDDLSAGGRDVDLATFAGHPNVQVRVFNPFPHRSALGLARLFDFLADGDRLNRRMHNKLWIADNAVAVIGGRNLGDAYFDAHPDSDFADLDVLAAGPVVTQVSGSFDAYWNSEAAVPIAAFSGTAPSARDVESHFSEIAARAQRFRETDYARTLRTTDLTRLLLAGELAVVTAPATVLDDGPIQARQGVALEQGRIVTALRPLVEGARREVILVSPYFIPSERGLGTLCALSRREVRVRVLTNSLASTDVPVVHSGYARYRSRLLACGVELHELRRGTRQVGGTRPGLSSGASLHAKAVVVDRRSVLVGSMNLDPRSRLLNTEIGVLIDSATLGEQIGILFDEATNQDQTFRVTLAAPGDETARLVWDGRDGGKAVRYDSEPLASWWRNLLAHLLGALAPEELL